MDIARLDDDKFFALPFGKVLEVYVARPETELIDSAKISVSVALGNHPRLIGESQEYSNFLMSYVKEVISVYVENAAAAQLGLLSFGGVNSIRDTWALLVPELNKVKHILMSDEEAAEVILSDRTRTMNFLLAITVMTALYCQRNKQAAHSFGLKKSWFGGLQFRG